MPTFAAENPVRRTAKRLIRFCWLLALIVGTSANLGLPVSAAEEDSASVDYPLVLLNGASVQRWKDHAAFMFGTAQRPEMSDRVEQLTVSTLKDLGGIDRERPFGMMFYLSSDFVSPPIPITYVPITNLDDALQSVSLGTGTITAVEGKKAWNNIRYSENFLVRTRQVGNYLFMVGPDGDESTLDRNFPDPARLAARLSAQYDISVSLLIRNVQPAMKTLFAELLKNAMDASLQQRDGEPESAYRLRRANGESWMELLDRIVLQGEEFTIGARITPEEHQANIDIELAGAQDSKFAKFFQNMAGKRTYFGNLLTNPSTFTMSVSWLLGTKQIPSLVKCFEAAKKELAESSGKSGAPKFGPVIEPLFKVLIATAEAGHLDAFAQLVGSEQGKFALIAGTRLAGNRSLPTQMTELLQYAKDNSNGNQTLSRLELNTSEIESSPVHSLEINPPDKPGQRMFGETAKLYLCTTSQAIWVAFGGDAALDALRDAMVQAALPQNPSESRNRVPFIFVTHANNWLSVADDSTPRRVAFNEKARASFEPSNDSMQLVIRPTDSGVRLRFEFQEGFVALMGRGFAEGIESGFFSPQQSQQRQRDRGRQGGGNAPPGNQQK